MRYVVSPLSEASADNSFALVIKKMQESEPRVRIFKIINPSICKAVGLIGLRWNRQDMTHAEIGVIILSEYQRKGLAHAAKSLLINTAFGQWNVTKIIAECDKDNQAANKANSKLGFSKATVFAQNKNKKVRWEMNNHAIPKVIL